MSPDRLLLVAVVVTLVSVDGVYQAWRQKADERIGPRLFAFYAALLATGSGIVWAGFLMEL